LASKGSTGYQDETLILIKETIVKFCCNAKSIYNIKLYNNKWRQGRSGTVNTVQGKHYHEEPHRRGV